MITTTDAANIIAADCAAFFIGKVYQDGNIPRGKVTDERIVIHSKPQQEGVYWYKNYVEANLCVPDKSGKAQLVRLQELEREARNHYEHGIVGEYDGTAYLFEAETIGIEADESLECHYVNVKILFRVQNIN